MSDDVIYDIETYDYDELVSQQVREGASGNRHPRYVMEPDELNFLRNYLNEGDTVIDCGANIGLHSVNFADVVVGSRRQSPHVLVMRRSALGNSRRTYSAQPLVSNICLSLDWRPLFSFPMKNLMPGKENRGRFVW